MALIIDLKPHEKIIIGTSLITNDNHKARIRIEGNAPILREKDIMLEKDAQTPCKRVYLSLQLMYLSPNPKDMHETYFGLIRDVQEAVPSMAKIFMEMNDYILDDNYYKALKEAKKLIKHEEELLANV